MVLSEARNTERGSSRRPNFVEVIAHDVGEEAPAPVGRDNGDSGQAAGLDRAPGCGQLERVGTSGSDELVSVHRHDRTVEFESRLQRLEFFILLIEVEGAFPHLSEGAQLIGNNRAQLIGHSARLGNRKTG